MHHDLSRPTSAVLLPANGVGGGGGGESMPTSAVLLPANGVGGGGGGESMIICSRVSWRVELHSSVAASEGDLFKAQPVHLHENLAELVGGSHIWKVRGDLGRAINGQDSANSFA